MSSENSYPRCAIEVRPSRTLRVYCLLLLAVALAAPWIVTAPPLVALPVSLFVLLLGRPMWHWACGEIRRLVWYPDGRWELTDNKGRSHVARLRPGIFVDAGLVALHWQCVERAGSFRAALLHDNCSAEDLRRLVVRLRMTPDHELFGTSTVSLGGWLSSGSG